MLANARKDHPGKPLYFRRLASILTGDVSEEHSFCLLLPIPRAKSNKRKNPSKLSYNREQKYLGHLFDLTNCLCLLLKFQKSAAFLLKTRY